MSDGWLIWTGFWLGVAAVTLIAVAQARGLI